MFKNLYFIFLSNKLIQYIDQTSSLANILNDYFHFICYLQSILEPPITHLVWHGPNTILVPTINLDFEYK